VFATASALHTDTITFDDTAFANLFSTVDVDSVRILDSEPLFTWLVDPPRIVLCDVVPRWSLRFPVGRCTTQLFEVAYHLLMDLLLGLGRFLLVLIVDVGEGVGILQRLQGCVGGGFNV